MVKKLKWNLVLMSVLYLGLGIFLVLKPGTALNIVCYALGGVVLACAAVQLIRYFVVERGVFQSQLTLISGIICLALGILAYVSSHAQFASYLNIMFIPGSEELVIFLCAFVGALTGFLWYNSYPAQVFMGDTGSLAIGGIIAVVAIIIHKELLLPLLCFVFFIESVSVLLQTEYAKMGNKRGEKWRVFKRAPIHDAFRIKPGQLPADFKILLNWPKGCWLESKITVRFWIITIITAALTIVTLRIR